MAARDNDTSWSCSSWLLAVFVILPLWLFAGHFIAWASWAIALWSSVFLFDLFRTLF